MYLNSKMTKQMQFGAKGIIYMAVLWFILLFIYFIFIILEECDLNELIRRTMYIGVLDNLFGDNLLPTIDKEQFARLERHFVTYDDKFEYGSQIPELFVK